MRNSLQNRFGTTCSRRRKDIQAKTVGHVAVAVVAVAAVTAATGRIHTGANARLSCNAEA